MAIGWIMAGFFIFVTMIFVVIAFFLPEWVGITGKKAREIMKEQVDESSVEKKKS
jgi:lipopolysaccharide export LptBFGC system permease protein LptF